MREITFEDIVKKIDICLGKLAKCCSSSETDNKSITVLEYLCKELGNKKIKHGMKNLFVIKQVRIHDAIYIFGMVNMNLFLFLHFSTLFAGFKVYGRFGIGRR